MGKVTVATVWTGNDKYKMSDVEKIRNMVLRNCGIWEVIFLCYTDQPEVPEGWMKVDLSYYPPSMIQGWWGKMQLFDTERRGMYPTVYFDLDTVIVGSIVPLFQYAHEHYFGICSNFTREVKPDYPCKFGSCVMTFHPEFGDEPYYVWTRLYGKLMQDAGQYGDQFVIQMMCPDAGILQGHMPRGFFVGRRNFKETLDPENAVMIFAGKHKPAQSRFSWVKEHWK